jgi:AcrR family transcriptional regulator
MEIEDAQPRGRGRPRDVVCRKRILRSALELLETASFGEITTEAIAERAAASKATIYRWWPNKDSVLLEALREAVAQELPFPETGDLSQDVRGQLRNFVKLVTGRRGRIFKAFIAAAQSDPEVAEIFATVWRNPRRATAKLVLERHRGGQLRADVDLDVVLDALYGPIYYRLLASHGPLSERYADSISDVVLRGIMGNEPRALGIDAGSEITAVDGDALAGKKAGGVGGEENGRSD